MDICREGGQVGLGALQDLGVQVGVGTRGQEGGVLEVVDIGLCYTEI